MRVLITDMPGPVWWEFLMQWGGLFVQAAAAVATFAAVYVALRVSIREADWRREERAKKRELAEIYAASLGNRIAAMSFGFVKVHRHMDNQEGAEMTGKQLRDLLSSLIDEIGLLDVGTISTLDSQAAISLMKSLDQAHAARLYANGYPDPLSIMAIKSATGSAKLHLNEVFVTIHSSQQ